jgi:hypothetical protein
MARPLAVSRPRAIPWPWWRHDGAARVAIGPDGRTLASAGDDGWLRLGDLELGTPTFALELGGPGRALALSASVAVVGVGATVVGVHVHGGRVQHRLELTSEVLGVAVSPDGATVAAITGGALVRARVATGRRAPDAALPARATSLALIDAGAALVGTADGRVLSFGGDGVPHEVARLGAAVGELRRRGDAWVARLADGRVVDAAGASVVAGAWSAIDVDPSGRIGVAGPAGWGIAGPDGGVTPRGGGTLALALHPDGEHAGLVGEDGAVGLVRS